MLRFAIDEEHLLGSPGDSGEALDVLLTVLRCAIDVVHLLVPRALSGYTPGDDQVLLADCSPRALDGGGHEHDMSLVEEHSRSTGELAMQRLVMDDEDLSEVEP